jgi:hypothetical protein
MAQAGLMIGWDKPTSGREREALEVFNDSIAYYGRLQSDGRLESMEVVFLSPHGGDLGGFILLRGTPEQMDSIRRDEEFEQIMQNAALTVDGIGLVDCYLNEGVARGLEQYQAAIDKYAG